MPEWLSCLIKQSCDPRRETKFKLVAIEAFISILESHSEDKNVKTL